MQTRVQGLRFYIQYKRSIKLPLGKGCLGCPRPPSGDALETVFPRAKIPAA